MSSTMRFLIVFVISFGVLSATEAQDFRILPEPEDGMASINCDLANEPFARMEDGTTISVAEYLAGLEITVFDHCLEPGVNATYSVSINQGTNIRDAASTQSRIVGKGQAGEAYEVFSSTEGDRYIWLEIRYDGQPAYVAEQLTVRLPDVMLEENGDGYQLTDVPCVVAHSSRRDSRTSLQPVLYGQRNADVDVMRQGDQYFAALRLLRSDYDPDTDGTYYRYGWQSAGTYTLQISYSGETAAVGFLIEGTKTHFLQVSCE